MKKKAITALFGLFVASSFAFALGVIEKEFEERFVNILENGDFSPEVLEEIWLIEDSHPQAIDSTQKCLKKTISRGLVEIRFDRIAPKALEKIKHISSCENADCRLNLEPVRIATIMLKDKTQWSVVLGKSSGQLYIIGHKKQIKAVVDNSVRASLHATL